MSEKNTKTTISGVIGAVGVLCIAAAAVVDGDPETVMDTAGAVQAVGVILAAIGIGAGGVLAKDGDK
jgi:drug/metabolite transporter (DMT)-like permease